MEMRSGNLMVFLDANTNIKYVVFLVAIFAFLALGFFFLKLTSPTGYQVSTITANKSIEDFSQSQITAEETTRPLPTTETTETSQTTTEQQEAQKKLSPFVIGGGGGGESSSSSTTSSQQLPIADVSAKLHDNVELIVQQIVVSDPEQKIELVLSAPSTEELKKLAEAIVAKGGEVESQVTTGNLIVAFVPANQIYNLAAESSVSKIYPNREVEALLDYTKEQINAPSAWNLGFGGRGIKIAILDSGVDENHEMLKGKILNSTSFVGENANDRFGHGTYVAGIAAGSKSSDGKFSGIAPEAQIINAKVLNDNGVGTTASVIQGIEWAVKSGAKIIVMSFSGKYDDLDDPINLALNDAIKKGVVVVVSSGNCGSECPSSKCGGFTGVGVPASNPNVITVGAIDKQNVWACFSSGVQKEDGTIKPDVVAPGVDVTAPSLSGYSSASGTSVSAPHVAGAVAILLQKDRTLSPVKIKEILEKTSTDLGAFGKDVKYGSGLLDIKRAVFGNSKIEITSASVLPEETIAGANISIMVKVDGGVDKVIAEIKTPSQKIENVQLGYNSENYTWGAFFGDTSEGGIYIVNIKAIGDEIDTFGTKFRIFEAKYENTSQIFSRGNRTEQGENITIDWRGIEPTNNVCWGSDGTPYGTDYVGYWNGNIWPRGDSDWMSFRAEAPGTMYLYLYPPSSKDYVLDAYKGCSFWSGAYNRVCYSDSGYRGGSESCSFSLSKDQTVWFRVYDYYDESTFSRYNLHIYFYPSCTPNSYSQCSSNKIYWYDSCGNSGSVRDSCTDTLSTSSSSTCSSDRRSVTTTTNTYKENGCTSGNNYCNTATVPSSNVQNCASSGNICYAFSSSSASCVTPSINNAYWSTSSTRHGTQVTMTATTSYLDGQTVTFDIYEDDGIFGRSYVTTRYATVSRGIATATWTAQWQSDWPSNPPEFVFVASAWGKSKTSGLMIVEPGIACYSDSDCGSKTPTGSAYCSSGDVYQNYKVPTCNKRGTTSAYCTYPIVQDVKYDCTGTRTTESSPYCSADGTKVLKNVITTTNACDSSTLTCKDTSTTTPATVNTCSSGCKDGQCISRPDLKITSDDIIFEKI